LQNFICNRIFFLFVLQKIWNLKYSLDGFTPRVKIIADQTPSKNYKIQSWTMQVDVEQTLPFQKMFLLLLTENIDPQVGQKLKKSSRE